MGFVQRRGKMVSSDLKLVRFVAKTADDDDLFPGTAEVPRIEDVIM